MIGDQRQVRQMLRVLVLAVVAALAVAVPAGQAQAGVPDSRAQASVHTQAAPNASLVGAQRSAVRLETTEEELLPADIDLVVRVRLAGLWETPAGTMAVQKGVNPRVRQIGQMIATQHVQLDALCRAAAKKLGVALPGNPNAEQQRWLDEMAGASGEKFDDIFVTRLRVAHGKVFSAIAAVRAGTRNDVVRELAQQSNAFVMTHMTLLESTGLVAYDELTKPLPVPSGPVAGATGRSERGGMAVQLIWLILAVALVSGAIATTRMIRPKSFGGQRTSVRPRLPQQQYVEPEPQPARFDQSDDYPYPRANPRSRVRSTAR